MATRGMRVLVAVDGSPCSTRAVGHVLGRPWPPQSEFQVTAVAHTRIPLVPEPTLTGYSLHEYALDEQRAKATATADEAAHRLTEIPGATVTTVILDGDPARAVVEEAGRWAADLVVVGSHGHGAVARALLGSVSQYVATHAPCSVEIARCPHADAG